MFQDFMASDSCFAAGLKAGMGGGGTATFSFNGMDLEGFNFGAATVATFRQKANTTIAPLPIFVRLPLRALALALELFLHLFMRAMPYSLIAVACVAMYFAVKFGWWVLRATLPYIVLFQLVLPKGIRPQFATQVLLLLVLEYSTGRSLYDNALRLLYGEL